MRLTDLQVDGFGVLSGLRMEELTPGLNVVHGPNGSGKSTLVQFVGGVWSGFDDARRRRFLPPLSGGNPGGSIGVVSGERSYRVTRQALPNGSDRFAVAIRRGTLDDSASIRALFDVVAPELVQRLYAAPAGDAAALEQLLRLAAQDGIVLTPRRRPSTRFDERLAEVRRRRTALLGGEAGAGETARLRAACGAAADELRALRHEAERLREQLAGQYSDVFEQIERLARRVEWLDLEHQAVTTDIQELESQTERPSAPRRQVTVVECHDERDAGQQTADLDRRIAHARAVLEDLARHRMQVSVQRAQVAGLEAIDVRETLVQQRQLVGGLEQELCALRDAARGISADGACGCSELTARVEQSVHRLQQQIYLLCQQLARQEQAQRQELLSHERTDLDRCEIELLELVARLQRERTQLLDAAPTAGWTRLQHPSPQEEAACDCREHRTFVERAQQGRRVEVTAAVVERPTSIDARLAALQERRRQLDLERTDVARAWRDALAIRAEWDLERSRLVVLERRIAEQQVEVEVRERQLAARLAEGQSLLVVEAGLERMRDTVHEDEPAQVIAEASACIAELTSGRYRRLQVTPGSWQLAAVNDTGVAVPIQALSRGTLEQVGLSLRIALADEYARRGVSLPLVFDEALADSDPDRLDLAIGVLQRVSERRQILFFTCQEHLATRFEAAGTPVRDFPGTRRERRTMPASIVAAAPATAMPASSVAADPAAPERLPAAGGVDLSFLSGQTPRAIHPGEPHWLRVSSPVSVVPSVGEQMARRLAAAGVRTVGDLVELDIEEAALPVASLQITSAQWRIWQAEGRLLCCVPHLTGRDAQVLVATGMLIPRELAEADPDELVRKIDRLRGDGRSGWVLNGFVWPDRPTVARWIECGRQARTWREACAQSTRPVQRKAAPETGDDDGRDPPPTGFRGRHLRIDQPSAHRGPRTRRRFGQRGRLGRLRAAHEAALSASSGELPEAAASGRSESLPPTEAVSPQTNEAGESAGRLRFFLDMHSSVVDAPSIGPTTARRLERIGVLTVADLLNRDAQQIAGRLDHRRITADVVRLWQAQARLMCRVPELRGHDAQVLTACGLTDPEAIGRMSSAALYAVVGPFVATREGQRLLRSAKCPDLEEVADWIRWAQQARTLRAA